MARVVTTLLAAALATQAALPTASHAQAPAPLTWEGKKLDVKMGAVKDAKTILVPAAVLRVLVDGSVSAVAQRGGGTARSKAEFAVSGIDKAFLQQLAREAQDDLVARLRADGWTVLTYDDVKGEADVAKMKRYKPHEDYGMPAEEARGTDKNYLIVTPSDEQAFDPPMQGPLWPWRHIAKDRQAAIMIPEYWIDAPQLWGETRRGFSSSTAKVNADDGMTLGSAGLYFMNHKGGWGWVRTKEYALVSDKVGEFVSAEDQSPTVANAVSKGLSLFAGGAINRKKISYAFTANPELYRAAVLRATTGFNAAIAGEAAKERRGN